MSNLSGDYNGEKKERKAEKHIVNFKVWVGYEKQDPHLNMNFR